MSSALGESEAGDSVGESESLWCGEVCLGDFCLVKMERSAFFFLVFFTLSVGDESVVGDSGEGETGCAAVRGEEGERGE